MNSPLISYKILSSNNIGSFETPATEAMSHMKQHTQDNPSWFYVDGQPTNIEVGIEEILEKATSIVISKVTWEG